MRKILIGGSILLLAGCDLTAQLVGDQRKGKEYSYTVQYSLGGQEHSLSVTFWVDAGEVINFSAEPGAVSGKERAVQLALLANVRRLVLRTKLPIQLPPEVGDASPALIAAFQSALDRLHRDAS